jgi:hypothetical protein
VVDRRDGQEETSELVTAIGGVTPEAALAMTDVGAAAAAPVVDAFLISMGANVVANLNQVAADTGSNFSQVTASIKNSPLDLPKASLPAGKKTVRRITGAWG